MKTEKEQAAGTGALECITAYPSAEENLFNQTVTWANGKKFNTINVSAYNDEDITYIKVSNTAEGMTIRYANPGVEATQSNGRL